LPDANQIERNKQLLADHYGATVSQVDFNAIREHLSSGFTDHESPPGTPPGPEWVLKHVESFHAAFPDIRVELEEIVAERDLVTVRATWTGTHQGMYLGFQPTHRRFRLKGIVMWRIQEGKITERWGCLDRLGLMQQLGVMPNLAACDFEQQGPARDRES
jgi:predicted ester cyclase